MLNVGFGLWLIIAVVVVVVAVVAIVMAVRHSAKKRTPGGSAPDAGRPGGAGVAPSARGVSDAGTSGAAAPSPGAGAGPGEAPKAAPQGRAGGSSSAAAEATESAPAESTEPEGPASSVEPAEPVEASEPAEPAADEESGVEAEPGPEPEAEPEAEVPEAVGSRMSRLRARLARSGGTLGRALLKVLSRDQLSEDDWDELEETLLTADVGSEATGQILGNLRTRLRVEGKAPEAAKALREELLAALEIGVGRDLAVTGQDGKPGVVLVVGVNGSGKTTTIGRLARLLVAEGHSVLLGAADTFRAAATEQLETWGKRVGVDVVGGAEGSDPA
ncbi:MAG: signal recognition particle receptor subunit alpha, partial [Bifidobacteriaceae bacterium]|nr:signal recognition particle receptor subunit alpha [Bifidobacteriaceae bacterium]